VTECHQTILQPVLIIRTSISAWLINWSGYTRLIKVCCSLFIVCCLLFTFYCLLFIVYFFIVYCVLFIVYVYCLTLVMLLREIEGPWKQITGSQLIMLPLFLLSYITGLYHYPRGRLFTKLLPYVTVIILFILFIFYNGSIVVGMYCSKVCSIRKILYSTLSRVTLAEH